MRWVGLGRHTRTAISTQGVRSTDSSAQTICQDAAAAHWLPCQQLCRSARKDLLQLPALSAVTAIVTTVQVLHCTVTSDQCRCQVAYSLLCGGSSLAGIQLVCCLLQPPCCQCQLLLCCQQFLVLLRKL